MTKQWVESCLILDIQWLKDHLPPASDYQGRYGSFDWSRDQRQIAAISYRLLYDAIFVNPIDPRTWDRPTTYGCWIELERTPSQVGPAKVWFCCPSCGRRARKLYLPPTGGRFLCRTCHDLTYGSRFHRPSLGERYRRLEEEFERMKPGSRTWYPTLVKLNQLARQLSGSIYVSDYPRELLADLYGDEEADDPSPPRAPAPMPETEPAGEELVPEPAPPRPRGRPKTKRPYTRKEPRALSTPATDTTAYCPKCRDRRELIDAQPVTFANGRSAVQGRCAICGTRMGRLVRADPAPSELEGS